MTRNTIAAVLLVALGAVACSDTAGPAEPDPDPGPTLESRWDMAVTVRYVSVSPTAAVRQPFR